MTTLATLDGSLRNNDQATVDAINLCAYTVGNDPIVQNPHAYHTVRYAPDDARKLLSYIESDDDQTASDAREQLEQLMYETSNAMYELGYYADWKEGWFYVETIDDDESETE